MTVNGQPAGGAWYFEDSALIDGYPIEAHYRPQTYWPAHAAIQVTMNTQGVSAGAGLVFDDSLTESWTTGRADILAVDGTTQQLTVTSDGALYGTFPVSLGAPKTPTLLGTKVIMEFDRNERMIGPGYNEIVPYVDAGHQQRRVPARRAVERGQHRQAQHVQRLYQPAAGRRRSSCSATCRSATR